MSSLKEFQTLSLKDLKALSTSGKTVVLHIQVKECYSEPELETLLETIIRRGAHYRSWGDGRYRIHIPAKYPWIPFYKTIRDCGEIRLLNITTVSQNQRHIISIQPEG